MGQADALGQDIRVAQPGHRLTFGHGGVETLGLQGLRRVGEMAGKLFHDLVCATAGGS